MKSTVIERGVHNEFFLRGVPPLKFAEHLFPPGTLVDTHFDITCTIPCNWILRFRAFTPGTATEGPPNGELILDTYSSQAVTPRNDDWVDYYYSWGTSRDTDVPGLSDMLLEAVDAAFLEDKAVLEAQWERVKQRPDAISFNIVHDAAPTKMLRVLDKFLDAEAKSAAAA